MFTAFGGDRIVARGDRSVVESARRSVGDAVLILDDRTGRTVDVGSLETATVEAAIPPERPSQKSGRGRPKLGVTAREVTLLPRHWDWLAAQPGGASAALRRLVDQARKDTVDADARRQAQEVAYRVATTLAGDRPGYEEAIRALFAGDMPRFDALIAAWPPDIAAYLRGLTAPLNAPS